MFRISGFAFLLFLLFQFAYADWNQEVAFQAGLILTPVTIGEDINLAGAEKLVARLKRTPATGARIGLHKDRIGIEGSAFWYARQVSVENEFGVDFPNHGGSPFSISGSATFHSKGIIQPFVSLGAGFFLISVDLDNVKGQEFFFVPSWQTSFGVRFFKPDRQRFFFAEYRICKTREQTPLYSFRIHTLIVGFGFGR